MNGKKESKTRFSIHIADSLRAKLNKEAAKLDRSVNWVIEKKLEASFK